MQYKVILEFDSAEILDSVDVLGTLTTALNNLPYGYHFKINAFLPEDQVSDQS